MCERIRRLFVVAQRRGRVLLFCVVGIKERCTGKNYMESNKVRIH